WLLAIFGCNGFIGFVEFVYFTEEVFEFCLSVLTICWMAEVIMPDFLISLAICILPFLVSSLVSISPFKPL
ncbi:hypothetical protein BSPWISOXPB_4717, partial [uncultured Gammaproteobacteria bacterium]